MGIVVQKFGGTSVGDVDRIREVARKVVAARGDGFDVVVVVSAMAGATDALLELARRVDPTPPRRELDMLLTTGERVSMALLSMAIQRLGVDAISFTGSQSGILTNDRHYDATILEVRPHRIEDELARGRVVIVAGYQGMSYRREITTLGRGGSDATAAALAAALRAERAEIYSDVDGVYTADPRVVPEAAHHARLGYAAMAALARAGAKVLHAGAVDVAARAGLPLHARATFAPGRETVVSAAGEGIAGAVGVVGRRAVARVVGPDDEAAARRVGRALEEAGVPVADARGAARYCATQHATDWPRARERVRAEGAAVEEGLGVVTVVVAGASAAGAAAAGADDAAARGRLVEALERAGVAVGDAGTTVDPGAARHWAAVEGTRLDEAVRAAHAAFAPEGAA